jgi:hypothetical protein
MAIKTFDRTGYSKDMNRYKGRCINKIKKVQIDPFNEYCELIHMQIPLWQEQTVLLWNMQIKLSVYLVLMMSMRC